MVENRVNSSLNQEVTKRLGLVAGLQLGYNNAKHGYNIYLIQEYTYNACHSAEALAKEEGLRSITAFTATQLCGSATQHKYLIYRGYTNHEHLEEFALINMNGRMYDPIIGRMLSPDNYVQSGLADNYNRYSYVLNNPLKYTDPSGEFIGWDDAAVAGAGFAFGYVSSGVKTGDWGWSSVGKGVLTGAMFELGYLTCGGGLAFTGGWGVGSLVGGYGSMSVAGMFLAGSAVNMATSSFIPSYSLYQSDNLNISVSPMIGFGSAGPTGGLSLGLVGQSGDFSYGLSAGIGTTGMSDLSGLASSSNYWNIGGSLGYTHNSTHYGIFGSVNSFSGGNNNQGVAAVGVQIGDFSARLDEDFIWDKGDRYRTGGFLATYKINNDVSLAFGGSMGTGDAIKTGDNTKLPIGPNGTWAREDIGIRVGTAYGGIIYKNQAYFGGVNSEGIEHGIQNFIHRNMVWMKPEDRTPYFPNLGYKSQQYGYYGRFNANYLYY